MKRMRSWSTCRWGSYTASTHGQTSGGNWTEGAAEKGAGPNPGDRRDSDHALRLSHSYRRATRGSTCMARRAGTHAAATATVVSAAAANP
jgi:hypothetical protein